MEIIWINGQEGSLPLAHRGLAYGDGLFETIFADSSGPRNLHEHLQRMSLGIKRLSLSWSNQQTAQLTLQLENLCSGIDDPHVLKIMLLRNYPGRGYDFDPFGQQTDLIIQISPFKAPAWASEGADVILSSTPISENRSLAGLKHLNRLDSVMARQDARKQGAHEALMMDAGNFIVEGSMSNVYFKIDGVWVSPPLVNAGVNGIMRQKLLAQKIVTESSVSAANLKCIEAAALSNSLLGIVPIVRLADRNLPKQTELHSLLKN